MISKGSLRVVVTVSLLFFAKILGITAWGFKSLSPLSRFQRHVAKVLPIIASSVAIMQCQPQVALADMSSAPWDSNIQYAVVKQAPADSPMPKEGDLVAVRFQGKYKGIVFDDTFKTEEPYFFRAGVGLVVKGLDESIINMHVGDRLQLQFSGDYACEFCF